MTERGRLPAGTHVGAFCVVRLLAEGGMGRVYEVIDPSIDKPYVIKTLKRDMLGKPEAAERMRLEQRALAELDHPNIVQIITAGEHEGSPYLVMEKLSGATLRHVLRRSGVGDPDADGDDPTSDQVPPQRPIRWEIACSVAIELLEALAVAHTHPLGIVHRDVKPENVFVIDVRGRLRVKLLDFGIASLSNSAKQTVGMFRGTPRYAAPEQLRGERVTPATDLYAVGLLLFEMIAGRDPFWGERQLAIGRAHLEKSPPAVSSLLSSSASASLGATVPAFPAALDGLIARALAKTPSDRPENAQAFADELRRLVRTVDAIALAASTTEFLGRIRGAETIASTTDLLAGLGGPDSQKPAKAARPKAEKAADPDATDLAAPPVMTLAYGESAPTKLSAKDANHAAPVKPANRAPAASSSAFSPSSSSSSSSSPYSASPHVLLPQAPWPPGSRQASSSEQLDILPIARPMSMTRWAALGGVVGGVVVAALAFQAGRHERNQAPPVATPTVALDVSPATDTVLPSPPAAIESASASSFAIAAPSAAASPIAIGATATPAVHLSTPHASSKPRAPAASVAAPPPKPPVDVDGVPHVSSGL